MQDQSKSLGEFDLCKLGKENLIFLDVNESKQYRQYRLAGVGGECQRPSSCCTERSGLENKGKEIRATGERDGGSPNDWVHPCPRLVASTGLISVSANIRLLC